MKQARDVANQLLIAFFAFAFFATYCDVYVIKGFLSVYNWSIRLIILLCLLYNQRSAIKMVDKNNVWLFVVFFIYISYISYYMFFGELGLNEMMAVPKSLYDYSLYITTTIMLLLCSNYVIKKVNYDKVCKYVVVVNTLALALYVSKVNMTYYSIFDATSDFDALNMLSPFTVCSFSSLSVFSGFHLIVNRSGMSLKLFSWLAVILGVCVILLCNKRGPMIFLALSLLIFTLAHQFSIKRLFVSLIVLAFLCVCFVYFLDKLSYLDIFSFDRFEKMKSDGISGRVGDFSLYSYALRQIKESLLFGSHFRILSGPLKGSYPHNFFLEILMTFGLFFSVFLCVHVWGAIVKCVNHIKNRNVFMPMVLLFNLALLSSTGSVFGQNMFWIPLFMMCSEKTFQKNVSLKANSV